VSDCWRSVLRVIRDGSDLSSGSFIARPSGYDAVPLQNDNPGFVAQASDLVERYGSPLFVFDEQTLRENYRELRRELDDRYPDSHIHYAVKANYNLGLLSILQSEGCAAEVYGDCEMSGALQAGFEPGDLMLTGMNRRQQTIETALEHGVNRLLVDNATELEKVCDAADATGSRPGVLIRGNPAMEVPTNPDIATATRESKFGLDIASGHAMEVAKAAADATAVVLEGVHLHIGSQITSAEPYEIATREIVEFAAAIRDQTGVEIETVDMGGGFPVSYDETMPSPAVIVAQIATAIEDSCREHGLAEPTLLLEPGRRIVGSAGALLTTVGVIKETPYATFAVLDAGSTLLGDWRYPIYTPVNEPETHSYDVAGPLCYTGDVIAEDVTLPELTMGDVVVVDRVGAYTLTGAGHTNAEPLPPAVLLDLDGEPHVIRKRETCEDVFEKDVVPPKSDNETPSRNL